jgi:hypothetical protein
MHRENRDGTIDSICRACFATVRTSVWESELELAEKSHACEPLVLERWKRLAERKADTGPQQR